jgi:hypothetical protein
MATIASQLGTISDNVELTYNGYSIPPYGLKVRTSEIPVYDSAGKTIKYTRIILTADFVTTIEETVSGYQSTDNTVDTIRRRLHNPCKRLTIKGLGLGEMDIRQTTTQFNNGPKTVGFEYEQLQSNRIAHIIWTVEFNVANCTSASPLNGLIVSYNYSLSWDWDDLSGGVRTRVATGVVETNPFTSIDGQRYSSYIERAKELIKAQFPRINGYDRKHSFQLSEDRKELSFTITDTEKMTDQPLPEPMCDLVMRQSLSGSRNKANFNEWQFGLTASVLVFKPRNGLSLSHNKTLAWIALGRIIIDRLIRFKTVSYSNPATGEPTRARLFVDDIQIDDEVTGNSFDFSVRGTIWVTTEKLFEATGMFKGITGVSNNWGARDNFIIGQGIDDLNSSEVPVFIGGSLTTGTGEQIINPCNQIIEQNNPSIKFIPSSQNAYMAESERPEPDEAWRYYYNHVELVDVNESTVNVPLSENPPREESIRGNPESPKEVSPVADPVAETSPEIAEAFPTVHNPTGKLFVVVMKGMAERDGYRINAPNLISYGGMKAVKYGRDKVASLNSIPRKDRNGRTITVYRLVWTKTYILVPMEKGNGFGPTQPENDKYVTDVPKMFRKEENQ